MTKQNPDSITQSVSSPRLMIIAGEVSGDMHAAKLISAIKSKSPNASFFGIGGDEMRNLGAELFHDTDEMAVMGLAEVLSRYGFFKRVFNEMVALATERKPDAVILVDYPGFNLRFARVLHKLGIKVIYYICPQVWAWHKSRIPEMARIVDHLITIFPFEAKHFDGTGMRVTFAGHPLTDEATKALAEPLKELPWTGTPQIALLPGSREHEIRRLLPLMWQTAELVNDQHPDASFIIAAPAKNQETLIRSIIEHIPGGPRNWKIVTNETRQILRQAKAAIVASGTATIETALMRCPMIVTYKVAPLTYMLGRMLIRVSNIGMVNIVAGHEICPEFVQHKAKPSALAKALEPLLTESPERKKMLTELDKVKNIMGSGNAAEKAAQVVLKEIG